MSVLIAAFAAILLLLAVLALFLRADPSTMARSMRRLAPLALLLCGLGAISAGRAGLALPFLAAAILWLGFTWKNRPKPSAGQKYATVRTAALEMNLDHRTGRLEGLVLAGLSEGRMLGSMELHELTGLYREVGGDPDSVRLLEAYLDSRFPVWREHAQPYIREGLGVAPGPGAMTKEEAYEVLGLEAGAAPAQVREAHRRLMQRLHPDIGEASFLAARINKAKDILLSNHN
ncbi:DnaJ domain-containing protein [Mesorhizobium sp. BE184]|uniref:DnaJ domain-containing protein n=1 Tax=Mesorhizobium sp. BE184 TaxID=2817714 RepID=UPI00286B25AB|nr:DnaJ domain-containing protein [Mesorhizobium sp. BE184]